MSFVKLDCGILDSSLWSESPETCKVFLTMLAMVNSTGICRATAPGIASRAQLPIETVRASLLILEAPDKDSRTTSENGVRISRIDGGYLVVNYLYYRERDDTAKERMRRLRARRARKNIDGVTRNITHDVTRNEWLVRRNVTQVEAEEEEEGEKPPPAPKGELGGGLVTGEESRTGKGPMQELVYSTIPKPQASIVSESDFPPEEDQAEARIEEGAVPPGFETENKTSGLASGGMSEEERKRLVSGFNRFWGSYPKHVDKQLCLQVWCSLLPDAALVDRIVAGAVRYGRSDGVTREGGRFCLSPVTFLERARWEDEGIVVAPIQEGTHTMLSEEEKAEKIRALRERTNSVNRFRASRAKQNIGEE